jgi:hypothetical protein
MYGWGDHRAGIDGWQMDVWMGVKAYLRDGLVQSKNGQPYLRAINTR